MNVLIPTDFSDNAWNAVAYALSLLEEVSVSFHLLHVRTAPAIESGPEIQGNGVVLSPARKINANSELKQLVARVERNFPNQRHRFETHVEHGFFIKEMRQQVAQLDIDLIIMGTKGASGIKKYTLGSNAGDVITKVKCPVLVIPERAKYETPRHIAFPTDFNLLYKNRILKTLGKISKLHHSQLHVVHVTNAPAQMTDAQRRNKAFLVDSLSSIQHSFYNCTAQDLEEAIQRFVEKNQINMIAMVAKNLNFFQRILFRPTVRNMSYHTEVPFLVLHE
ncbi:MAG: universal stress protein [Flavobacteriaceae bacterium]|mgnify:CR=1 FL=1|nr:universal stress protein [Flavobacteriaceae bacterium]